MTGAAEAIASEERRLSLLCGRCCLHRGQAPVRGIVTRRYRVEEQEG
ncbi:hypothetical protein ADP8_05260 (plasmid) [Roseomonas mucosa]|nr:hypothetical protein ADP8_05260 [Roseomonas mucosa]